MQQRRQGGGGAATAGDYDGQITTAYRQAPLSPSPTYAIPFEQLADHQQQDADYYLTAAYHQAPLPTSPQYAIPFEQLPNQQQQDAEEAEDYLSVAGVGGVPTAGDYDGQITTAYHQTPLSPTPTYSIQEDVDGFVVGPTAPTSTTRGGGGSSMIGQPPKRTHQRQEQKHASKPKPNTKSKIAGRSNNRSATLSAGYGHRHYFFCIYV